MAFEGKRDMLAVVVDIAPPLPSVADGVTGPALREGLALREAAPCPPHYSAGTMADFCLFAGLDPDAAAQVERLLSKRLRFRKGDALYRVGDSFNTLYAIRTGSCKTVLLAQGGQDQVAGYHMAGEIIGMDGIGTDIHDCQATALEDMQVCPLPFDQIESLARRSEPIRYNLHRMMSREYARARSLMIVLGTMRAEQRLAVFLLDLSQQNHVHGYSSCEFVLRMTREEIGSYLGLKLETVSRLFSRFQHEGLIQVQGRAVKLLDRAAVSKLVDRDDLRDGNKGEGCRQQPDRCAEFKSPRASPPASACPAPAAGWTASARTRRPASGT